MPTRALLGLLGAKCCHEAHGMGVSLAAVRSKFGRVRTSALSDGAQNCRAGETPYALTKLNMCEIIQA